MANCRVFRDIMRGGRVNSYRPLVLLHCLHMHKITHRLNGPGNEEITIILNAGKCSPFQKTESSEAPLWLSKVSHSSLSNDEIEMTDF